MKKFWKSLGAAAAYFGVFLGIQFLVSLAGTLLMLGQVVGQYGLSLFQNVNQFHRVLMQELTKSVTVLVLISNLVTVLAFFLWFRCRGKRFSQEIGLHRTTGRNMAMSVILGIGLCFFMDLLTAVLPISEQTMEQFESQHNMLWFGDAGITFLSVAIAGPVSEEICFRGLVHNRLRQGMGPWLAGILSSVLFGMAHGDPVWFLVGFVAGLALSWTYEVTGSLWCPIVVHVTNNAISSMTAYLPISETLHTVLVAVSVVLTLGAGWLLYRWNRRTVPEEIL